MKTRIFLIIFCCLSGQGYLYAQNLYNQSVISIGSSSVLYVKDTIINQGTIVNNGDMQVGGSWINNAQYDAGQGQITFNSDLRQIINHNDQSFSRLTISGGGEKVFLADITIENELHLTDGILVSENNSRIVLSATAEVTGGSDHAHVRGAVYHLGEGDKIFPVGNGTVYLPVELLNIKGASSEVGVNVTELNGVILAKSPSLDAISSSRYWELDVISGSLNNSLIILPVRDESIVGEPEAVIVSQSDDLLENFEGLGGTDFQGSASDGKVTSKEFVSKRYVAIAISSDDSSLIVYNAVSPNNDGFNDYLIIGNIESYPENRFTLFNRWGDKVFEIDNYDNKERVFRGKTNVGGEKILVNGTYFYTLVTKKNSLRVNGFIALKN